MADTLLTLLTLTLVCLTTARGEECPTTWPGGAQLGVPEYFYPFNPGVDMVVPEGDDTNSPRLTLPTVFPFYGQFFTYMYVSTNGALYFADPPTWFPRGGMPLKNIPLIGPLFVDTDSTYSDGRVYYRATTEAEDLCRFSAYVREKRLDALNFKATWAFVGTWHNLTSWKGNSSDPVNTFQVVIGTDGHNSFALFNYGELNWSIAPGIIHSQVGFNSGIGDNHYVIPESGTGTTTDLDTLTGNTQEVGRLLFRINKDTINGHGSEGLVASFTVEENKAITLACPSEELDYTSRFWFRGYFDDSDRKLLFSQTNSSTVTSHNGDRMDMSVNNATFELTIGEVRLEDGYYFSCEVLYGMPLRRIFDNVELQVYIQPEIMMTGLEVTTFTTNTTVKVTCTILRVSPAIKTGAFQLLWGALNDPDSIVKEYKSSENPDNSFKYTITRTKTVTREDDGKVVTCSVVPVRGSQVFISRTLTYLTVANIQVTPSPSPPKMNTNVVAIAGGIAGGVGLLLIIIVIGFICMRRRNTHGPSQSASHEVGKTVTMDNQAFNGSENNGNRYDNEPSRASERQSKADRPPTIKEDFYEEVLDPALLNKGWNRPPEPLPDQTYEEIKEPEYYGAEVPTTAVQHESPYIKMKAPVPTFEEWVETHHISAGTQAKLRQHQVTCTEDLRRLRTEDVRELGLVVGERIRLLDALAALK